MRRCLIISALLLAGCGPKPVAAPVIPADLLTPCVGWQGPRPSTEGQFARAALAERTGRLACNEKIRSIGEIVVR